MLCIDTNELAHLLDVQTEEELEILDMSDFSIIYSAAFYKSSAGGVAKTSNSTSAGLCPCYHSVSLFNGQLFVLGSAAVHLLHLRTWSERLNLLIGRNQYPAALALARTFLDGSAKLVVGLAGSRQKRRETVSKRMTEILIDYVDSAASRFGNSDQTDADQTSFFQVSQPGLFFFCCCSD